MLVDIPDLVHSYGQRVKEYKMKKEMEDTEQYERVKPLPSPPPVVDSLVKSPTCCRIALPLPAASLTPPFKAPEQRPENLLSKKREKYQGKRYRKRQRKHAYYNNDL
jgi:hypothetical protein